MAKPSPARDKSPLERNGRIALAIVIVCLWSVFFILAGPGVIWTLGIPNYEAYEMAAISGLFLICLLIVIIEFSARNWGRFALLVLGPVACAFVVGRFGHDEHAISRHFEANRIRYEQAARWAIRQENIQAQSLPAQFEGLSRDSIFHVYVSEANSKFVFFPIMLRGIDNEIGIVWGESGDPPPPESRLEVTVAVLIERHWFIYRTT